VILPEVYTIQKFHQLAGYAKKKHNGRIYEAGCPICKEGNSWGKKRRLYYMISENHIFCHNCGWSGNPISFIKEVQGISYKEILKEIEDYDILPEIIDDNQPQREIKQVTDLPTDSVNLLDDIQTEYYRDDKIVNTVIDFTLKRNLFSACNRPKTLWVSLKDNVHRNRLVLPFYDEQNNIAHYQSRAVLPSDNKLPKYLSKIGSEKTLFNINNIDPGLDKIFIFEGPIDSCFVKNGVAVAGIQENSKLLYTARQKQQLASFPFHDVIWVLDSQQQDSAAMTKTEKLIEEGQTVFVWPSEYGTRYKDFNDMAIDLKVNEIPYKFILKNSYTGLKAKLMLGKR